MPVLTTHSIIDFPIGNLPLCDHHAALGAEWQCHENAWIAMEDLSGLEPTRPVVLIDTQGTPLAWTSAHGSEGGERVLAVQSFLIRYSWELLRANESYLATLTHSEILGTVHPGVSILRGYVRLAEGAELLPGVVIEGNVVIDSGSKIGPNCYLRGLTSIGPDCHVGNAVEIKNSILLFHACVGHLSYVGDSILGERVNLGAGTITANFRHDGKNHRTMAAGKLVDTGRRKFGAIIGDDVHTGIHTSIYPGRKIGARASTLLGEVVRQDIPAVMDEKAS